MTLVRVILLGRALHPPSGRARGRRAATPVAARRPPMSMLVFPGLRRCHARSGRRPIGAALRGGAGEGDWGCARRGPGTADVQRARLPRDGDVGAPLEQPPAASARAAQDVARLRCPPGRARELPGRPRGPPRGRARRPAGRGRAVNDAAPRPGVRGVLAVLREPYWLRAGFLVVALSLACVYLGRWQWGRHEGKVAMAQQIDRAYDARPASLAELVPVPTQPLPKDEEWRPVQVRGAYLGDDTVVIRNRPDENGEFGYEVVVPFRVDGGPVLLVDRGWIPNGASGARPDTVPAPPTGEVGVVARLRPTERPVTRVAPAGQAERIDVPRLTAVVDGPAVTQAYGILAQEQPASAGAAPALIPRPDEDLGPHQAYAIQWWLGAVAVYVLLVVYARKEAQGRLLPEEGSRPSPAREPVAGPDSESGSAGGVVRAAPGTGGRGGGRVPALRVGRRSGPRELTDEEWEDLADARLEAGVGDRVVGGGARVDDHDAGARTPGHVDE